MKIPHASLDKLEDGELGSLGFVSGGSDSKRFLGPQGIIVYGEQRMAGTQQVPERLDGPVIIGAGLGVVEVLEIGLEAGQLGQALA